MKIFLIWKIIKTYTEKSPKLDIAERMLVNGKRNCKGLVKVESIHQFPPNKECSGAKLHLIMKRSGFSVLSIIGISGFDQ